MNFIVRIYVPLAIGLSLMQVQAFAAEPDSSQVVEEKIRSMVPNAKTIAVSETPLAGLLQVQVNSDIVYVSADGQYLLQGQMMDLDSKVNLTDQAMSVIRKELLVGLNSDEEITFAPEEPKYELLVFTDIDCAYCRKLHSQMEEYNKQGIAIHYLGFPRAGIGSASYDKYVSVWCADDQKTALTLAKSGTDPQPLKCDNPVASQYRLGRELGVTGTPALVTASGVLIPGYVPPAQLRHRLASLAAAP